ncbi:MAG: hypothetical protein N2746_01590 [Deltaproteobacteria bacterium]|nr:hypothetical protein [Deltaproteobacteria bacterium]
MFSNKVVARFKNGAVLKGTTTDFNPEKPTFHLQVTISNKVISKEIKMDHLKAVFFVKTFEGNPQFQERKTFTGPTTGGIKIKIFFIDGEILVGTTNGYKPDKIGFWFFPADKESNNIRVFVINSAVKGVKLGVDADR